MTRNQTMVAVGLEVAPGALCQTFGIGHLYAGRYGIGVAVMLSYWTLQAINAALTTVGIGFVTGPLTWLAYTVMSPSSLLGAKE